MSRQTTHCSLGLKKAFRTEMFAQNPILFQLCQGQLSVITKNCNHKTVLHLEMFQQAKFYLSFSKSQPRLYS